MLIAIKPDAKPAEIEAVRDRVTGLGYDPRVMRWFRRTVIGAAGNHLSADATRMLRSMVSVEDVFPIEKRYQLGSRDFQPQDSVVRIGGHPVGGGHFQIIAGPCAIEERWQIRRSAEDVMRAGIRILRGGAFKPRTSPYDFQGLGEEGLDLLAEVKAELGIAIVTEVLGADQVPAVARVADALQIGARNCQNYHLLAAAAQAGRPVLLKRGMGATVEEWLGAAEYLLVNGCTDVVLCERGIRTFENATRSTLDVGAVALAKAETHLPVIVDPSHAAGRRDLVEPLARAGIAAGADGLIIEAHPMPQVARCDAAQQIPTSDFAQLVSNLRPLIDAMGKRLV